MRYIQKKFLEPATLLVEALFGKYHHLVKGSAIALEEIDGAITNAVLQENP
ncbi:hypothetical protein HC928_24285 [bacterium]|nr:hypothetical protein [bacterium]